MKNLKNRDDIKLYKLKKETQYNKGNIVSRGACTCLRTKSEDRSKSLFTDGNFLYTVKLRKMSPRILDSGSNSPIFIIFLHHPINNLVKNKRGVTSIILLGS